MSKEKVQFKNSTKFMMEVKKYLRKNGRQVKMFIVDNFGLITTTERKDLGRKGYKAIHRDFNNFEDLKQYYVESTDKVTVKDSSGKPRGSVKVSGRVTKSTVAKPKPQATNRGRNNVRAGKAGRKVSRSR